MQTRVALVNGVDENEEGQFEHEARHHHGVNVLGEPGGELAESGFDALAKILNQKALGG